MISNGDEGRKQLKIYRLYHIGGGGGIEAATIVEASEHPEAIMRAKELLQTSSGELWLEDELVSTVRQRD